MALGSHVPEWKALQDELRRLAAACSADLAAVMSTGNVLWCVSRFFPEVDDLADAFYRQEVAPRRQLLTRGLTLDVAVDVDDCVCVARSFASIYALVLWFRGESDIVRVRALVRAALPRIEELTISLPPPNPEPAEGVGKFRA